MAVLALNAGSSSLKYRLIEREGEHTLVQGLIERIGGPDARLRHRGPGVDGERAVQAPDHATACGILFDLLEETHPGLTVEAVGHRVVHGGEHFAAATPLNDEVIAAIQELTRLAPLHNPLALAGIHACRARLPGVPQAAVFDTAFHQSLPEVASRYAVPEAWRQAYGLRRYGFHGISHAYVAERAARHLCRPPGQVNLITLHLGNGASATAIRGGRSVDTSMGLTPTEGLVMGTRCGDLDPAIPALLAAAGLDAVVIEQGLTREGGLKGLCGDADLREVERRAEDGDAAARLALELYVYRIRKYIGAYAVVLGRVDGLVFTAGVGENSPTVRAAVCAGLEGIGMRLDPARNAQAGGEVADLHDLGSPVAILAVRTDEELEIARETVGCLGLDRCP